MTHDVIMLYSCLSERPLPSKVYQQLIGEQLTSDPQLAVQFVDSILTQLNWCFSEFIGNLKEVLT